MANTITKPLNLKPDEEVGPPVVRIRNLWTRFGRTVVHQDLNLDIYAGEILSIVGGSGTGKTVLLRQMLGLEHPPAETELAATPGVIAVERVSDKLYRVQLASEAEGSAELVARAAQNNWGLSQLTPAQTSLEDVFVNLTT